MKARALVTSLALSAAGLVGLALHEGYTSRAVIPVKGDVPTLGFGSTRGVRLGDTTTPPQALARAQREISTEYEPALKRCLPGVMLTQGEYDAYVDTAYNIGTAAFCRSTMARRLVAGDHAGACQAILMWKMYHGHDCSAAANQRLCGGLWARRQRAHSLCLGEGA